jgi:hypothetical protein
MYLEMSDIRGNIGKGGQCAMGRNKDGCMMVLVKSPSKTTSETPCCCRTERGSLTTIVHMGNPLSGDGNGKGQTIYFFLGGGGEVSTTPTSRGSLK